MVDDKYPQPAYLPFLEDEVVLGAAEGDQALQNLLQNLRVVEKKIADDEPFVQENDNILRQAAEERVSDRLLRLNIARTQIEAGDD